MLISNSTKWLYHWTVMLKKLNLNLNTFNCLIWHDIIFCPQDGLCHYNETKKRVQISSYTNVTGEEPLKMALFNKGAVAVNIDASHKSLSFYESGVYFEPDCSEYEILLVYCWMLTNSVNFVVSIVWAHDPFVHDALYYFEITLMILR